MSLTIRMSYNRYNNLYLFIKITYTQKIMIKKYHLYLVKSLILPILIIATTLTSIIWLTQATRIISSVATSGSGILNFIKLSFLLIPSLLVIIIPISNFVATLYAYNKLSNDSELTALENMGLSRFQISLPVVNMAIISSICCYILSLYVAPLAHSKFKDNLLQYRNNLSEIYLEEAVFNTNIKNLTIYIDEHKRDGSLKGILVNDEINPSHRVTILANSGKFTTIGDSTRFELFNGSRQEIDANGQLAILYFDHLNYDLSLDKNIMKIRHQELQETNLSTLLTMQDSSGRLKNKIIAEINLRLCWPLYGILLSFIALIALYPAEFSRKSKSKRLIKYSILSMVAVLGYFIGNNFADKYIIMSFWPWINFLLWLSVSIYLLFFQHRR